MVKITKASYAHACMKWMGRTRAGAPTIASDAELYHHFSALSDPLTTNLLVRFAIRNNEVHPTGGYSIIRGFWGGMAVWKGAINEYIQTVHQDLIYRHDELDPKGRNENLDFAKKKILLFSEIQGNKERGKKLGIVAASKILFFSFPHVPFYIIDQKNLEKTHLQYITTKEKKIDKYFEVCESILADKDNFPDISAPTNPNYPTPPDPQWFKRRCVDLAIYDS